MAARIKMPLGMEVALGTGDFVLDGDPVPPGAPQFSAQVYRGKTAGWIKMVLGTEVGLSPGHIVLDGDPAPLKMGAAPPLFGPCLLWENGWIDQDAIWDLVRR